MGSTLLVHDDWLLTPEGAAIHAELATAVVADLHLGYEWAREAAGDCIPAHSLAEALARLERVLKHAPARRVVVAGDLVESHRPCARTRADALRLASWLADRGVELVVLAGNHDLSLRESGIDPRSAAPLAEELEVGGWTIAHGHRPITGPRSISGHVHPVLCFEGATAPCFVVSSRMIVLPAFTNNAAGRDVASAPLPHAWARAQPRCIACAGDQVIDLGPIDRLRPARRPTRNGRERQTRS